MITWIRRRALAVGPLDDRILPAAVLTYTDVDGDLVTVRTSAGTDLTGSAHFDAAHHQLQTLDLSNGSFGNTFLGTSVTITAKPGPTGGDGLVNVGYINATGIDLGAVSVHGDLTRIDAGTGGPTSVAVKSLAVMSMGRFGDSTQGVGPSLFSNVHGALGSLMVHGDLDAASIEVTGPNGKAGSVRIGGSLVGGLTTGEIRTAGSLGPVTIGGDLIGGGVNLLGTDFPTGILASGGRLAGLTIGGSVIGAAFSGSGEIALSGDAGPIRVGGSLVAGGGLTLSGSIVESKPDAVVPSVSVGGDLMASIDVQRVGAITVHGSVGDSTQEGSIEVHTVGVVRIGGSMTGALLGRRVGSLIVGGSLRGSITVYDTIGQLVVRGSAIGARVSVQGPVVADGKPSVAIGTVTVFGRVENTQILAGFDPLGMDANADAQIGTVTVHGDWIASDLAAGIDPGFQTNVFGDGDDHKMSGFSVTDHPHSFSRIGPVVIQWQLLGTPGGVDSYGIEAEQIVSLTVAGVAVPLKAGRSNDTVAVPLGATGDVVAREF